MSADSLSQFVSRVTDDANNYLESNSKNRRVISAGVAAITAALITSTATIGAAGINTASSTMSSNASSQIPGRRRNMRIQIKSNKWGCLRLVVGTMETTLIIPPSKGDGNRYSRDEKFLVVLANGVSDSTAVITAEYTGIVANDGSENVEVEEKMEGMAFITELATREDVYLSLDHTETIPKLLISANIDDINDWGTGIN